MANFYWRGQHRDNITGISAFDFNEPSNWVTFEIRSGDDCIPFMSRSSDGKVVIEASPVRGIGIDNYGLDDASSGYGWGGDSNVCRAYSVATRAPGPGDVVVVGDDYAQAMSPLIFGGFIGGETGGVWLNGADDGSGGYTHAVGGTTDSSLAAFYYGGMGLGHPDFNYPWQRIGGGFTANAEKYRQQLTENRYNNSWAEMLWNFYFVSGGTYIKELSDGTTEIIEIPQAIFGGATWTSEQLTQRTQSLRIKSDYIEEAARSYQGAPHFADLEIVKNTKPATDPETLAVYNRVVTNYNRYSRNVTSFIKGYCRLIQNLPANTLYKDWHGSEGEPFQDEVHDIYYMNPDEALILDGVTAASVRCYVPDRIKFLSNSVCGSFHIDDTFTTPEDKVYCLALDRMARNHIISGKIDKDLCLTDLGLTGTAEAADLDSKLLVRASMSSFFPTSGDLNRRGTFTVLMGNNTGLSGGVTCSASKVDIQINDDLGDAITEGHKPIAFAFAGTAPIVVNEFTIKNGILTTSTWPAIDPSTPIYIGVLSLGQKAWFYPSANDHANWYFGIQNPNGGPDGTFVGGIKFLQEANATDFDYTSEFALSPYFRLHSAMVGLTAPASLTNTPVFRSTEAISRILKNNVGSGS